MMTLLAPCPSPAQVESIKAGLSIAWIRAMRKFLFAVGPVKM